VAAAPRNTRVEKDRFVPLRAIRALPSHPAQVSSQPPNEPGAPAPAMIVDVPLGEASAAETLAAVDLVLGGDLASLEVRVLVADDHPGRAALAELCAMEPRVRLVGPDPDPPECEVHVVMPPVARPGERTLVAIQRLMADDGTGVVVVPVPGRLRMLERFGAASRLPGVAQVRARSMNGGGGVRRVGYRAVELGSSRMPRVIAPPPPADLSAERSEHLRHRARAATNRSRTERQAQRLARERMRIGHERARSQLLDRRIAATGPRYWLSWRVRRMGAIVLAIAIKPWQLFKRGRTMFRRFRRKAVDRVRRLRSPQPKTGRHRPGA